MLLEVWVLRSKGRYRAVGRLRRTTQTDSAGQSDGDGWDGALDLDVLVGVMLMIRCWKVRFDNPVYPVTCTSAFTYSNLQLTIQFVDEYVPSYCERQS